MKIKENVGMPYQQPECRIYSVEPEAVLCASGESYSYTDDMTEKNIEPIFPPINF